MLYKFGIKVSPVWYSSSREMGLEFCSKQSQCQHSREPQVQLGLVVCLSRDQQWMHFELLTVSRQFLFLHATFVNLSSHAKEVTQARFIYVYNLFQQSVKSYVYISSKGPTTKLYSPLPVQLQQELLLIVPHDILKYTTARFHTTVRSIC